MAVKFAEGWQKKAGHETIRRSGDSARKAAEHAEKAARSSAQVANKSVADTSASRKPAHSGEKAPEAGPATKPQTHDQSSRNAHAAKAAEQHVKVRQDARNLQTLSSRGTQHANTGRLATREAVAAKPAAQDAQFAQQNAAATKQPAVAQQVAQPQVPVQTKRPNEGQPLASPAAKAAPKSAQKGAEAPKAPAEQNVKNAAARPEAAAQNAAAVVAQPGRVSESTGRTHVDDTDDDNSDEDRDHNTSAFSSGSRVASTKRELGGLLGGSAGEGDEPSGEGADPALAAAGRKDAAEKLPEKDPGFQVYSEFDEANPGVEHVKARAQVFNRLVEKRIGEIAKLDQEIEGKIRDMFEASPLSERLSGELAGELKAADFLSSVYGGLIG